MLLYLELNKKLLLVMEDNLYYKYGKTTDSCKNCPCKLYNKDKIIYLGKGNIYNRIIFVLPSYNIDKSSPIEEENT